MRIMFLIVVLTLLVSATAHAQRVTSYTIEPDDIEIRFPGAASPGEGDWMPVTLIGAVTYSTEPLRQHKDRVKLGPQTWEAELQEGMAVFEKGIFAISVTHVPQGFRVMELRVRVSVIDSTGAQVKGGWSTPNNLKIVGKPGNPFQTG
jgi:hypothetical protein